MGKSAAMERRKKDPEPTPEPNQFSSSRRAADAWAETPESWRHVQIEQLSDALAELRERGDQPEPEAKPANARRARRFAFVRRFSH